VAYHMVGSVKVDDVGKSLRFITVELDKAKYSVRVDSESRIIEDILLTIIQKSYDSGIKRGLSIATDSLTKVQNDLEGHIALIK
jgi:hypothetical protein